MERFASAAELLRHRQPNRPMLGLRPHAAARAACWFQARFPGTVTYALKANDAPEIVAALAGAGIRHFETTSLPELARAASVGGAELVVMSPVCPRDVIRRAYAEFGVRTFALDSVAELDKIMAETGGADDLTLFVRLACADAASLIPLEGKFGVAEDAAAELLIAARRRAKRLGVTFHVGSQAMKPEGFASALETADRAIAAAGVQVDCVDVGGGFPSIYPGLEPVALDAYITAIVEAAARLERVRNAKLFCAPGRALVAEAESVLVRVEARRGTRLYINDGAFGTLYDAAHSGLTYPARLVRAEPGPQAPLELFTLYGPTCDSADVLPGPFPLPGCIQEGDYVEIGQIGAYGRVMASRFNGFGDYDQVILEDAPMLTLYGAPEDDRPEADMSLGVAAATASHG